MLILNMYRTFERMIWEISDYHICAFCLFTMPFLAKQTSFENKTAAGNCASFCVLSNIQSTKFTRRDNQQFDILRMKRVHLSSMQNLPHHFVPNIQFRCNRSCICWRGIGKPLQYWLSVAGVCTLETERCFLTLLLSGAFLPYITSRYLEGYLLSQLLINVPEGGMVQKMPRRIFLLIHPLYYYPLFVHKSD